MLELVKFHVISCFVLPYVKEWEILNVFPYEM